MASREIRLSLSADELEVVERLMREQLRPSITNTVYYVFRQGLSGHMDGSGKRKGPPKSGSNGGQDRPRQTSGRRSTAPDDFPLTDRHLEWVRKEYGSVPEEQVREQTVKFLEYHRAKGTLFRDWNAAWRNWMRNWRTDFGRTDGREAPPAAPSPNSRYDQPL